MSQKGFTLVEVMIVVVIIGLLSAMVALNTGSLSQRKQMLLVEALTSRLESVRSEARQQNQLFGLLLNNQAKPVTYRILQYVPEPIVASTVNDAAPQSSVDNVKNTTNLNAKWQENALFPAVALPEDIELKISPMEGSGAVQQKMQDQIFQQIGLNQTEQQQRPAVVWFGDQGTTPVQISFIKVGQGNFANLYIDSLGQVTDEPVNVSPY